MGVIVQLSEVSDGSMYDRTDPLNKAVIANRRRWLGAQNISLEQTTRLFITYDENNSYVSYRPLTAADRGRGMEDGVIESADAIITTTPGHALFLPVADCIATTLYDPDNQVLMLSHLGRQSLEKQGGVRSVEYLVEHYGSKPQNLQVWTSPSINKDAYPIFKLDNKGMKEAFFEQLAQAGVVRENIYNHDGDTGSNDDFYSYSEFLKGNKPENGCHAMVAMMQL